MWNLETPLSIIYHRNKFYWYILYEGEYHIGVEFPSQALVAL